MLWPFLLWPALALLPAAVFFLAARETGRGAFWFTSLIWALYGGYEWMIQRGSFCSGDCNIRVDLLLIVPILLWRTISGLRILLGRTG